LLDLIKRARKTKDYNFYYSIVDELLPKVSSNLSNQFSAVLNWFKKRPQKEHWLARPKKTIDGTLFGKSTGDQLNEKLFIYNEAKQIYDLTLAANYHMISPEHKCGLAYSQSLLDAQSAELKSQADELRQYTSTLENDTQQAWD